MYFAGPNDLCKVEEYFVQNVLVGCLLVVLKMFIREQGGCLNIYEIYENSSSPDMFQATVYLKIHCYG